MKWTSNKLRTSRARATLLLDGKVLIAGGAPECEVKLMLLKRRIALPLLFLGLAGHASMMMAQGLFTATGSMTTARGGHSSTLLVDGRVLILGGSPPPANPMEIYDPSTGTFSVASNATRLTSVSSATLLNDGRVLILGLADNLLSSAELYDPNSGTSTPTGDRTTSGGRALLLHNGKVFIAAIPNAELYDPATGTFTAAGAYAGPGLGGVSTATLLADGRVLITGCTSQCDYDVDVTELSDPVTGTFSLTGAMTNRSAPFERTASLLTNGKVLFAGGENEDFFYASAELFDPSTGTFTATADMTQARHAHSATLLSDGEVLITGGALEEVPPFGTLSSAELYDPSTGTFRSLGNMTMRREYFAATLLNSGKALIAGGAYWNSTPAPVSGILASAELYTPPVSAPAPVLFPLSGDGMGQGAIWDAATGQAASVDDPAMSGAVLAMYTTSLAVGGVIPPQVAVGGRLAEILFFGDAPGYPGFSQVNFRLAIGVAPGLAVPVRLICLGRSSNEVTIAVQ